MRCAVCGSERMSPLMQARVPRTEWGAGPELRFGDLSTISGDPSYRAGYARVCRDCGAVQFFLSESDRRLLDGEADDFEDAKPRHQNAERGPRVVRDPLSD